MKPNGQAISLLMCALLATMTVCAEDAPSFRSQLNSKSLPRRVAQVEERIILKDPNEIFSTIIAPEFQYSDGKVEQTSSKVEDCCEVQGSEVSKRFVKQMDFISEGAFVDAELAQNARTSNFYTQIDLMFLHLGGSNESLIPSAAFIIDPTSTETPIQRVEDGRYRAIPRITVGMSKPGNFGWELTYFGRNNWQKSAANLNTDGTQFSSLSSAIQSGEANFLKSVDPLSPIQIIAGFRYFQFDEHLDLLVNTNSFNATSAVSNNLFGGQLGARYSHTWKRLSMNVTGKFGVFNDFVTTHESSLAAGVSPTSSLSGTSYMADFGATGSYQINQSCSFRFGYQFLMLDGIARAAGQIDRSGPLSGANANDNCILHGPTAGLEFRY